MRANSGTDERLIALCKNMACLPDGFALLGDVGVPHAGDAVVLVLASGIASAAPAHHVFHDPG